MPFDILLSKAPDFASARAPVAPLEQFEFSAAFRRDAGAIRLTINGKDQGALGDDGEVLTRTVKVPAPPSR